MVSELCISTLMPKAYYELYMMIFDNLRYLANLLSEAHTAKKINLVQLYELVQYSAKIVPRLYMMITVGSAYMRTKETPVYFIMRDLLDMSLGVQHPIRGLFLRYYLSIMTKDELPDLPISNLEAHQLEEQDQSKSKKEDSISSEKMSENENEEEKEAEIKDKHESTEQEPGIVLSSRSSFNVLDSIRFILENFVEMNKLWVRLQHQGFLRDKEKRESERKELRILIGSNLVRLSQLECVDLNLYKQAIFQPITQQILQCKDVLAQEYLLEVIIQVFPDSFHLKTVKELLNVTAQLQPQVNVNYIVSALIDRIRKYHSSEQSQTDTGSEGKIETTLTSTQQFEFLWSESKSLINSRKTMALQDIASLLLSMVQLAVTCYPDHFHYTDEILIFAKQKWDSASQESLTSSQTITYYHSILSTILLQKDLIYFFRLPECFQSFRYLLSVQPYATRHHLAVYLIESLVKSNLIISTEPLITGLMDCLQVLFKDQKDGPIWKSASVILDLSDGQIETRREQLEALASEQCLMAKFILLIYHDDPDVHAQLLLSVRKSLSEGGGLRIRHTYPPLIYQLIRIVQRIRSLHPIDDTAPVDSPEQLAASRTLMGHFKSMHQFIQEIQLKSDDVVLALELYLIAARGADKVQLESICYEFFVSALTVYEESVNDSRQQFICLAHVVNYLLDCTSFNTDNYATLSLKCTVHAARMLKRHDQCRAMLFCSHLFWHSSPSYRDPQRVLDCLQRSIKFADACLDTLTNMELLIEILVRYLYFLQQDCPTIFVKNVNHLLELIINIRDHLQDTDDMGTLHQGFSSLSLTEAVQKTYGLSQQDMVLQYFRRVCNLIEKRQQSNSELSLKYREIFVPRN
ncbi:Vacuolar protein sorting-associated protein 35 [Coelomomyces lativittatus]|nr:Vacuolar protein sorting-associated protein 35 [Coelomomyces lativittatus]